MASEPHALPHSLLTPCPDPDLHDRQRAQGISPNRKAIYQIEFTHKKLYRLLKILEELAVKAEHYPDVEELCRLVKYIREQAEGGGDPS